MLNVFIDTNVLLSFYHLTSEDLEELKKFVTLVDNQKIRLLLPAQVKDEFNRNRGAKIADAMKKFKEANFKLSFPAFAKGYGQYEPLRELMKKADALHAMLVDEIEFEAKVGKLGADQIVRSLFDMAKTLSISEEIFSDAVKRVQLGNPPGKRDTIGGAVNWECLLREAPSKEDIYIVSGDKDFRSQLLDDEADEYLYDEWSEKKGACLYLYTRISDFFSSNFPNIKIAAEAERDLLIERLANSSSFLTTHNVIAKLGKHIKFSSAQI
jgi:predicted nucleic acid-binding protein